MTSTHDACEHLQLVKLKSFRLLFFDIETKFLI